MSCKNLESAPQAVQGERPPDTWRGNADARISQLALSRMRTSGVVGDNGHGEVHLVGVHVRRGADGIVTRLQQRELGEEKCGRHLDGRELLQHLHHSGVLTPFPLPRIPAAPVARENREELESGSQISGGAWSKARAEVNGPDDIHCLQWGYATLALKWIDS